MNVGESLIKLCQDSGIYALFSDPKPLIMIAIACVLMYLAVVKKYEPLLLMPIAFGMLLRGQNLLGYKHYADDVVDFFVKKTVENGCDIIRCFDALNDLRNMETAVKATKKYGGTAEVAMSYTISPVHTEDYCV